MYLDPTIFKKTYKYTKKISHGSYGEVYEAGDYVVKIQKSFETTRGEEKPSFVEGILEATIREIDFYSRLDHPCVIKIIDWSIEILSDDKIVTYMSLPRGESIIEAFNNGKITPHHFCQDILSAIAFLHANYICHRDIKPQNIIYLNGHAVLIDFGIAWNTTPVENYALTSGPAFTPQFRDPQYLSTEENKDTCDEYAFGMTLYCLLLNKPYLTTGDFGRPLYPFILGFNLREPRGSSIIHECLLPVETRPMAQELIIKYGLEYIQGNVLETPIPKYGDMCTADVQKIFNIIFPWMFDVFKESEVTLKTLFLAIHLVHRSLKTVIPNFTKERNGIRLVCICCIYLASSVDENEFNIKALLDAVENIYTVQDFYRMLINIMYVLNGIITSDTYWFYAYNVPDITTMLLETFSCKYELDRIKYYQNESALGDIDKNIDAYGLLYYLEPVFGKIYDGKKFASIDADAVFAKISKDYTTNERMIVPINQPKPADIIFVENFVIKEAENLKTPQFRFGFDFVNDILHYASRFAEFTPRGANKLYNLLSLSPGAYVCLVWYYQSYLGFENINLPDNYVNSNFNPFNVSSIQELIENNVSQLPPIGDLELSDGSDY